MKEQVQSSMLDSLLQLSKRDTRLLMLVHKGRTTRSHANGEACSWLIQIALLVCCLLCSHITTFFLHNSQTLVAVVEDVGYLADAIQQSKQWEEVPFHEVQKSVQQLIHAGMLQEVNKEHGPRLQVRLGAACQEVEEMMRLRVFDGPLF